MKNKSDVPVKIYDKASKLTYIKRKLLGKDEFSKCYEPQCKPGEVFAGKITVKSSLKTNGNREKLQ